MRKNVRYPVTVRTSFSWTDAEGHFHEDSGYTRDISTGGMFIHSTSMPLLGATVQVEAALPAVKPGARRLRVETVGEVVRVAPAGEGSRGDAGFAVQGDSIVLFENDGASVAGRDSGLAV